MVFGWDDAIGGGFAVAGGIMNLINQGKQQAQQENMLKMALTNQMMQADQASKQYELATAGRTDSRGNKVTYKPGVGWVTEVTPETADAIRGTDAVNRMHLIETLTRGGDERSLAFRRRLAEGGVADALIRQLAGGFGAPTKEGVTSKNKVAAVTGVSENADNAKRGYAIQALRAGSSINPQDFSGIDRGTTTGIRKALADVDATADTSFEGTKAGYINNKLGPYGTLATRAANVENVPFSPDSIGPSLDASMANASVSGNSKIASGSEALYRGFAPTLAAAGNIKQPNYDTFIGGVGQILQGMLKKKAPTPYEGVPWHEDSRNPDAYNGWRF